MTKMKEIFGEAEYGIVVLHTEWCGFCKKFDPIFDEVSQEHGKQYRFAKVDAQKEQEIAKLFKVQAFPTIVFVKNGEEVGRELGYMTKEQFTLVIAKHFIV